MTQTVAITGASAGIGRATARLFAERGANVGLIARGHAGLDGAARDVEQAGGTALAVLADVADFAQVDAAAQKIEDDSARSTYGSTWPSRRCSPPSSRSRRRISGGSPR